MYFGKNVSPLSCALLSSSGLVIFVSGKLNDGWRRFLWKKCLPPFWHPSFDFSEVACWPSLCTYCALFSKVFGSDPLKGPLEFLHLLCVCAECFLFRTFLKVEAPWRFCTCCAFVPKVFWFGPFERSKPLGVFALVVRLCRRFLGSDLLKGRRPLAFCTCCAFVPKFFCSDLLKGRSPLAFLHLLCVCFDKYAKFTDSAYFANLLFCAACRCLPKLDFWAASAKVTLYLGKIHCIEIVYTGSASSKTSPPVRSFPL